MAENTPFSRIFLVWLLGFPIWGNLWAQDYPWLDQPAAETLAQRFPAPEGYARKAVAPHSFGDWLRGLPLKPGKPEVLLFNGNRKGNQRAHAAVVQMDVGGKDLQQCADAVIRLRAEYLYSQKQWDALVFHFTNGQPAVWLDWSRGMRPVLRGNDILWQQRAEAGSGYAVFRAYLETVFVYAGSASLSKELKRVPEPSRIEIGDVFIQGGFPGHAVLVLDVAENASGQRVFLLGQSYMPAQEFHVLKNPSVPDSAWYRSSDSGYLATPEWDFRYEDLKRFPAL